MSVVRLFDYDVAPIVAMLPDLAERWEGDQILIRRQPGSRPRDIAHQLASVATMHHVGALAVAIEAICTAMEGRPARASLLRLPPGGVIDEHTDEGIYAAATEQFHLPIVTNDKAWIVVDGERYSLEVGILYAVDVHAPHAAGNDGETDVVCLVVDMMPESPFVAVG